MSKRYGRLVKSQGEVLNGMMVRYRDDVVAWMGERVRERVKARRDARGGAGSEVDEGEDVPDEKGAKNEGASDPDEVDESSGAGAKDEATGFGSSPQQGREDVVMTTEQGGA